jgi:hypothetical protein
MKIYIIGSISILIASILLIINILYELTLFPVFLILSIIFTGLLIISLIILLIIIKKGWPKI